MAVPYLLNNNHANTIHLENNNWENIYHISSISTNININLVVFVIQDIRPGCGSEYKTEGV